MKDKDFYLDETTTLSSVQYAMIYAVVTRFNLTDKELGRLTRQFFSEEVKEELIGIYQESIPRDEKMAEMAKIVERILTIV